MIYTIYLQPFSSRMNAGMTLKSVINIINSFFSLTHR